MVTSQHTIKEYTRYTPTTQGCIQIHESTHQLDKGVPEYSQLKYTPSRHWRTQVQAESSVHYNSVRDIHKYRQLSYKGVYK